MRTRKMQQPMIAARTAVALCSGRDRGLARVFETASVSHHARAKRVPSVISDSLTGPTGSGASGPTTSVTPAAAAGRVPIPAPHGRPVLPHQGPVLWRSVRSLTWIAPGSLPSAAASSPWLTTGSAGGCTSDEPLPGGRGDGRAVLSGLLGSRWPGSSRGRAQILERPADIFIDVDLITKLAGGTSKAANRFPRLLAASNALVPAPTVPEQGSR